MAQAKEEQLVIPASAMPPEGMCRLWLKDVPERQQPAATDCVTAIRTRPRDAVLLLGEPSKNAKLPPRQPVMPLTGRDDSFGRRPSRNSLSGNSINLAPLTAAQRAQANLRNSAPRPAPNASAPAAVKAPDAKAAVVKPPEPR